MTETAVATPPETTTQNVPSAIHSLIASELDHLGELLDITGVVAETDQGLFIDEAVALVRAEGFRMPVKVRISTDETGRMIYRNFDNRELTGTRGYDIQGAADLREAFKAPQQRWRGDLAVRTARGEASPEEIHLKRDWVLPLKVISLSIFAVILPVLMAGVYLNWCWRASDTFSADEHAFYGIIGGIFLWGTVGLLIFTIPRIVMMLQQAPKSYHAAPADIALQEWSQQSQRKFLEGFAAPEEKNAFFSALLAECARIGITSPTNFRMMDFGKDILAADLQSMPQFIHENRSVTYKHSVNDALVCFVGNLDGEKNGREFCFNGQTILLVASRPTGGIHPL